MSYKSKREWLDESREDDEQQPGREQLDALDEFYLSTKPEEEDE